MRNEPVFPQPNPADACSGVTKLEYFVGQIASGYASNPELYAMNDGKFAEYAFNLAEAMCAEAEKRRTS